jgi:hypothetical protein
LEQSAGIRQGRFVFKPDSDVRPVVRRSSPCFRD